MSRRPSAPPARATRARRTTPTAKASRSPRGAPQLAAGKPRRQHHAEAGGGVPGCANHVRGIVVIVSLLPVASKRGAQCHEEHTAYLPSDSPYPRGHVRSGMPTVLYIPHSAKNRGRPLGFHSSECTKSDTITAAVLQRAQSHERSSRHGSSDSTVRRPYPRAHTPSYPRTHTPSRSSRGVFKCSNGVGAPQFSGGVGPEGDSATSYR